MRLGGLFLLLILSYFFNPIQPIVEDIPVINLSEFENPQPALNPELDASLIEAGILEAAV